MTVSIYWPSDFPRSAMVDSFKRRTGQFELTTPMDKGPAKKRMRGRRSTFITAAYIFRTSQIADLDEFCGETVGVKRFGLPDPVNPLVTLEVRFYRNEEGDHYIAEALGRGVWKMTFTFEVLP